MKKFLFLSFLCVMFTMFSNIVNAQKCDPIFDHDQKPGDGCCIWLEQDEGQIISPFADEDWALGGLKFNLNPIVPGENNGVAEYYYFRFQNCLDEPNPKLSIDWEVYLNGEPFDKALNATSINPLNRMNVEIEWFLPLINGLNFQGSGPLLSGMGNNSKLNPPYTTINGVKRAVVTDFPGQIDMSANGALYGYFNPYGVQNRWYNYIYADFLEWACENHYLRLKITRYTDEDVKLLFKIMKRVGGTDFQEYYIGENQHDYMGGHGASLGCEIGYFWLEEPNYKESEDNVVACSGDIISIQFDDQTIEYVDDPPAVFPDPFVKVLPGVPYYNEEYTCIHYIDSIVQLTLVWNPIPNAPVSDSVAICGPGEATLTASDPYESDELEFTYKWYADPHLKHLVYTGNPFTKYYHKDDKIYDYFVTSTVNNCEGPAERFVVWVMPQLELDASTLEGDEIQCNGLDGTVTLTATGGDGDYTYYIYDEEAEEGEEWIELEENTIVLPAGNYKFKVVDGKDCEKEFEYLLEEPELLTLTADVEEDDEIKCFGLEGTVTLTAEGGNGNNTYYIYDEEAEEGEEWVEITNPVSIVAGDYIFKVVDGKGCEATFEYTLDEPDEVTLSATVEEGDEIQCNGETGKVTLTAEGGDENYTYYMWDPEAEEGEGGWILIEDIDEIYLYAGTYLFKVEDGNECPATAEVTLVENEQVTLTADVEEGDEIQCYGETGKVTLTAGGGDENYTYYIWDEEEGEEGDWVVIELIDGKIALYQGSYAFKVEDGNGCPAYAEITLNENEPVTLSADVEEGDEIKCFGLDGKVTLTAGGGDENYTYYIWDEEAGEEGDWVLIENIDAIYIPAGTYTFKVEDGNGCPAEDDVTLDEPDEVTLTADVEEGDEIPCFGEQGIVTLTADGGDEDYTYYIWVDGEEEEEGDWENIDNPITLYAGDYIFKVEDGNGCSAEFEYTLEQPDPIILHVLVVEGDEIKCFEQTGDVTVYAEGGDEDYTYYMWDEEAGEEGDWVEIELIDGKISLYAGDYIFKVEDGNGCATTKPFQLTEPDEVEIEIDAHFIACTGSEATISLSARGGDEDYTFFIFEEGEWVPIDGNEIDRPAGTYQIKVEDGNGCSAEDEVTLEDPDEVTLSADVEEGDEIQCFGETGKVTLTADGGDGRFTYYIWDPEAEDGEGDWVLIEDIDEIYLIAGTYTFKVVDGNNCEAEDEITLEENDQVTLTADVEEGDEIKCFGETGLVTLYAEGGDEDYTYYMWDPEEGEEGDWVEIDNPIALYADDYIFKVEDGNGCPAQFEYTLDEPDQVTLTADVEEGDEIKCFGETGLVTLHAEGGDEDYTYYMWDPEEGEEGDWVEIKNPVELYAGDYTFKVEDGNNCPAQFEYTLEEPDQVTLTAGVEEGDEIKCYGETGLVTLHAEGGDEDYTYYIWVDGEEGEEGEWEEITNPVELYAGTYKFKVEDGNLCPAEFEYPLEEPDTLIATIAIDIPISCYSETATITVGVEGGVTPYGYLWNTEATTATIENLAPGTYSVTVTDARGCTAYDEIEIDPYDPLVVSVTGTDQICQGPEGNATAIVSGGDVPYTYLWSNGAETATIDNLEVGKYIVTVTDDNGCTAKDSIEITYYVDIQIEISAEKDCSSPDINIEVTSTIPAYITIQGYNEATGEPIEDLFYESAPNMVTLVNEVLQYSGTANFIYFIATATLPDIPCEYTSNVSQRINYNDLPLFYVYELPKAIHTSHADFYDNEMEVTANTEFKHYFMISDSCKTQKDLHLAVDYTYYYQADENATPQPVAPITDYLFKGINGTIYYDTPMPDCGTSVNYNYPMENGHFPYEGGNNDGWRYQGNPYNFFKLVFFDEREITVTLSGLVQPGIYTIKYELVTHYPSLYGNVYSGIKCNGVTIGGNGFYSLTYDKVVLGTRTMKIIVTEEVGTGNGEGFETTHNRINDPNTNPNNISETNTASATIYPNPASENINIKFVNMEGPAQIRIVNVTGSLVLDQQINITKEDTQISIADFKPGFYFVNIISKDAVTTRKLIVEPKQ